MYDAKMSKEAYGIIAEQMLLVVQPFVRLTQGGIYTAMTARLTENPSWNRMLRAAPALRGKQFPTEFQGMCNYIGLVEPRYDEETSEIKFPPTVRFEHGRDEAFTQRYTGHRWETSDPQKLMVMPLNLMKIYELAKITKAVFSFLYGNSGVGKSVSMYKSLPHTKEKPMLIICGGDRNVEVDIEVSGIPREEVRTAMFTTWNELIKELNNNSNFFNTATKTGGKDVKKGSTSTVKAPGI